MKKFICGVLVGSLCALSVSSIAAGIWDNISVLRNDIKVVVNGSEVTADNFVYEDTTYLPLRAVSTALGENVEYDETTNTAYIGERNDTIAMKNKYTPKDNLTWCFIVEKDGIYYISPGYMEELLGSGYMHEHTNYSEIYDGTATQFKFDDRSWDITVVDDILCIPYDTYVDEIEPLLK